MTRSLPPEITFAGARLPIVMATEGVRIGNVHADYKAIAWMLDQPARCDHFAEQVLRGEDAHDAAIYAVRPQLSDEELVEPSERWLRLSGSAPGNDTYLVGTSFLWEDILVPRAALLELFDEMRRLREEFPAKTG